jgi:multiple sugar transport system substrate-binding protein
MKKRCSLFAILLLIGAAVWAGGGKEAGAALPAYDPAQSCTLSIGVYDELLDAYSAVAKTPEFQKKFPNIKLDVSQSSWDGHHERLVTVIAAGKGANDIETIDEAFIGSFATGGGFTILSQPPFNGLEAGADLAGYAMENAKTPKGDLIALPVDVSPVVMFYRKSLADAAGVDFTNLPAWDAYVQAGKKVTKDKNGDGKPDQFLLATPSELSLVFLNNGIGCWFDQSGKVMEPKEKFTRILSLVKQLVDAGVQAGHAMWSEPWEAAFSEGKIVTAITGAWFAGALKTWLSTDQAGDWRVAHLPAKTYCNLGGSFLGIPSGTPNEKKLVAWEVIKFLSTNKTAQLKSLEVMGAFPALRTVYQDPFMSEGEAYFGGQKVREIYADVARNAPIVEANEYDRIARGIWESVVEGVISREFTVDQAYEEARSNITASVD